LPRGVYPHTHKRGNLWTPEGILAALAAFEVRHGRRPVRREWTAANGLPDRKTVVRQCGSLGAVYQQQEQPGMQGT